jgi:hypothetical protein
MVDETSNDLEKSAVKVKRQFREGKKGKKANLKQACPLSILKKWGREIRMKSATSSFAMAASNLDGGE